MRSQGLFTNKHDRSSAITKTCGVRAKCCGSKDFRINVGAGRIKNIGKGKASTLQFDIREYTRTYNHIL